MPPLTVKAITKSINNSTTVKCESRGFSFTLEQTKEEPEKNYAMNPMEAILCSLGGCGVITAVNYANKNNIKLNDISIELEGNFDSDGMSGAKSVRPGYEDITCKVILDTDASNEQIDNLIKCINETAPVIDTINNPVNINVEAVVTANY